MGVFLFISCGAQVAPVEDLEVSSQDVSSGEIIKLERQVTPKDCLAIGKLRASTYDNYKFPVVDFSYPSSILKSVYLGGKKEIFFSSVGNRSGIGENDYGKVFAPCFGYDYSEQNTYQSAAASALYSFSLIENVSHLLPSGISKVTLRVGANVQHIRERSNNGILERKIDNKINNAYYSYNLKEITFVPQGDPYEGISPFASIGMWKIPFIGVHEYGHHIFSHFMTNYIEDKFSKFDHASCSHNSHSSSIKGNNKSRSGRAGFSDVIRAFNEGIADLFATAVIGENASLKGITCFEQNRDVKSREFSNNTSKKMTRAVLKSFIEPASKTSRNCLSSINFNEPHAVGAIIAHTFYNLFEKIELDQRQRIKFIYNYLSRVNRRYLSLKRFTAQQVLEEIVYLGLETSSDKVSLSQKDKCGFVGKYFPTLHKYYSCK